MLEVVSSENGIIAAGGFAFVNTEYATDKIMVGWAGLAPLPSNGVLCKITFKAKTDGISEITIGNAEIYDLAAKDVSVSVKNGSVLVTSSEDGVIYGDVYCDYKVDVKDAQRLYMYIVGGEQNLTEYEMKAADVFKDGSINVKDAQKLAQYLADFPGIVLGE